MERPLHRSALVNESTSENPVSVVQALPELDDLFASFFDRATRHGGAAPALREWVDLAEAWRIIHALRATRGNRSEAARQLGIGRRTLYTKMDKLGIEPTFRLRG